MAVHYLRYEFVRKINVAYYDEDYQNNFTLNQLRKLFGMYNVYELDHLETLDENYVPGDNYADEPNNAESA